MRVYRSRVPLKGSMRVTVRRLKGTIIKGLIIRLGLGVYYQRVQ